MRQVDLALEIIGERNEKIEELQDDIADMKAIFRCDVHQFILYSRYCTVLSGLSHRDLSKLTGQRPPVCIADVWTYDSKHSDRSQLCKSALF